MFKGCYRLPVTSYWLLLPVTGYQLPGFIFPDYRLPVRISEIQGPAPGTLHPAPCTRYPEPGTRNPAPCTRHPAPCTRYPVPGTRFLKKLSVTNNIIHHINRQYEKLFKTVAYQSHTRGA
jgi:hypothetical protein